MAFTVRHIGIDIFQDIGISYMGITVATPFSNFATLVSLDRFIISGQTARRCSMFSSSLLKWGHQKLHVPLCNTMVYHSS